MRVLAVAVAVLLSAGTALADNYWANAAALFQTARQVSPETLNVHAELNGKCAWSSELLTPASLSLDSVHDPIVGDLVIFQLAGNYIAPLGMWKAAPVLTTDASGDLSWTGIGRQSSHVCDAVTLRATSREGKSYWVVRYASAQYQAVDPKLVSGAGYCYFEGAVPTTRGVLRPEREPMEKIAARFAHAEPLSLDRFQAAVSYRGYCSQSPGSNLREASLSLSPTSDPVIGHKLRLAVSPHPTTSASNLSVFAENLPEGDLGFIQRNGYNFAEQITMRLARNVGPDRGSYLVTRYTHDWYREREPNYHTEEYCYFKMSK